MHVLDHVVFYTVLLCSAGIGIWYSCRKVSSSEYLQARKQLSFIPVAISTIVSFVSAITIQGVPAEVYENGLLQYLLTLVSVWGSILAIWTFVPLYYNLQLTSVFQYLERRFEHRGPSLLACLLTTCYQVVLMGLAIMGPAQIMQSYAGTPTWMNIIILAVVGTFYTAIGGLKAVVWADVLQAAVMFLGLIVVCISGYLKLENPDMIWRELEYHNKLEISWTFSPFVRNSLWISCFSIAITNFQIYSLQSAMMRYIALDSMSKAKGIVVVGCLGFVLLSMLCAGAAVVVFAFYAESGCDPIATGELYSSNQVVPYFVMTELSLPGISGLFISAVVCSTLSSISSIQNGLAAVTWMEVFARMHKDFSDAKRKIILKATAVFYGLLSLLFAFTADSIGGSLFQISNAVLSVTGAPVFGMFLLAGTFPFVGPWSAVMGCIVSLAICLWISLGSLVNSATWAPPQGISDSCPVNITESNTTLVLSMNITASNMVEETDIYDTSPYLYSIIGTALCIIIALLLSIIPGLRQKGVVEKNMVFPFVNKLTSLINNNHRQKSKLQIFSDESKFLQEKELKNTTIN